MKIFISWSGVRSKKIAERLYDFLKSLLHGAEPFFSGEDIDKGMKWFETISVQLGQANFGIICLTRENWSNPWILFEAGALAKNLETANVCPVLFGLDYSDIEGPLSHFQLTTFNEDEIRRMCRLINSKLGKSLDSKTFDNLFGLLWPKAEIEIVGIVNDDLPQYQVSGRTNREILEDIWRQLRRISYTEEQELNDVFVRKLVDGLQSHLDNLQQAGFAKGIETLQGILGPIEYLIGQIKDGATKSSLIKEYEKFRSQVANSPMSV